MKGNPEQRRVVLRRLLALKEELGQVPNEAVDAAASMLGLKRRQVRYLIAQGHDVDPPEAFDLTETMIDYYFACRGNAVAAHDKLADDLVEMPVGLRQFQRAVDERVDQALRAAAKRGLDGLIASTVYLGREVANRNDIWAIDHTPPPIVVRPRTRGLAPYVPWATTIMDEATGMWMAETVKDSDPNAADTVATLGRAIAGFTLADGEFVGGLPDVLLSDRGGDLISDPVTAGLAKVLVNRRYTEPGSPWQNGKVERMQGLWQGEWITSLPGYLFGGRYSYQRKLNLAMADPEALLFEDQFAALLAQEIERWNQERPYKGKTPAERWAADSKPIRQADAEALRLAMLRDDQLRVVSKGTISFDTFEYTAPELRTKHKKQVEVRYLPGMTDYIEVYYLGEHLCRALRKENLTLEQRGRIIAARKAQKETFQAHLAQGDRINAESTRKKLRGLGYAEEDLPKVAGEERPAEADAPVEIPGQGDLLADLHHLPSAAAHADKQADKARRAAQAAPVDDLDDLAQTLGVALPQRPDDEPIAGTGA